MECIVVYFHVIYAKRDHVSVEKACLTSSLKFPAKFFKHEDKHLLVFDNLVMEVVLEYAPSELHKFTMHLPFCFRLMHSWWPEVLNVFMDRKRLSDVPSEKLESFYCSVSTLISNQVLPSYWNEKEEISKENVTCETNFLYAFGWKWN